MTRRQTESSAMANMTRRSRVSRNHISAHIHRVAVITPMVQRGWEVGCKPFTTANKLNAVHFVFELTDPDSCEKPGQVSCRQHFLMSLEKVVCNKQDKNYIVIKLRMYTSSATVWTRARIFDDPPQNYQNITNFTLEKLRKTWRVMPWIFHGNLWIHISLIFILIFLSIYMLLGKKFLSSGLEIHSQINGNTKEIAMKILYKFHGNDAKIAWKFSRNSMEIRHWCQLNGMEFSMDLPCNMEM